MTRRAGMPGHSGSGGKNHWSPGERRVLNEHLMEVLRALPHRTPKAIAHMAVKMLTEYADSGGIS